MAPRLSSLRPRLMFIKWSYILPTKGPSPALNREVNEMVHLFSFHLLQLFVAPTELLGRCLLFLWRNPGDARELVNQCLIYLWRDLRN